MTEYVVRVIKERKKQVLKEVVNSYKFYQLNQKKMIHDTYLNESLSKTY